MFSDTTDTYVVSCMMHAMSFVLVHARLEHEFTELWMLHGIINDASMNNSAYTLLLHVIV